VSDHGRNRQSKLRNGTEFRCVFDAAARSSDGLFTVLARSNGRAYPRLGLAIGKKWVRRAVDRNKIKRLIRDSFRKHQNQLDGLDLVVMSRGNGKTENSKVLSSLKLHWQRIENYKEQGKVPAEAAPHG